jgi:hypothetical protein
MNEGAAMKERTLVALEADDSFFNDWILDLYSLERVSSGTCSDRVWAGVRGTYAQLLIREN